MSDIHISVHHVRPLVRVRLRTRVKVWMWRQRMKWKYGQWFLDLMDECGRQEEAVFLNGWKNA